MTLTINIKKVFDVETTDKLDKDVWNEIVEQFKDSVFVERTYSGSQLDAFAITDQSGGAFEDPEFQCSINFDVEAAGSMSIAYAGGYKVEEADVQNLDLTAYLSTGVNYKVLLIAIHVSGAPIASYVIREGGEDTTEALAWAAKPSTIAGDLPLYYLMVDSVGLHDYDDNLFVNGIRDERVLMGVLTSEITNRETRKGGFDKVVVANGEKYGYTDVAIQAALDALPATGGKVYIPEGTWTITAPITRAINNVTIEGAGYNTILTCSGASSKCISIANDNWVIKSLRINSSGSGSKGIELTNISNSNTIKECYFLCSNGGGDNSSIECEGQHNIITNNQFVMTQGYGIYLITNGVRNIMSHNVFVFVETITGTTRGIFLNGADSNAISGNIFTSVSLNNAQSQYGIYFGLTGDRNIISSNIFSGIANAGAGNGYSIDWNAATNASENIIVSNNFSGNDINDITSGTNTLYVVPNAANDPLNNL